MASARAGLRDIERGAQSVNAMWLQMASTRLRESGILVPTLEPLVHLHLHAACLEIDETTGHATYRALNEELSSFLDALEARIRRQRRTF